MITKNHLLLNETIMMKLLGIGSRIEHPQYGFGVVTNLDSTQYWVCFQKEGIETVPFSDDFKLIEALRDEVDTN